MDSRPFTTAKSPGSVSAYVRRVFQQLGTRSLGGFWKILLLLSTFITFQYIRKLLPSNRHQVQQLIFERLVKHRPKVEVGDLLSGLAFDDWLTSHIKNRNARPSLRNSAILLVIQVITGRSNFEEDDKIFADVHDEAIDRNRKLASRVVFCVQGTIFVRVRDRRGSESVIWALNNTVDAIHNLLKEMAIPSDEKDIDPAEWVALYSSFGSSDWKFQNTICSRSLEDIYMMEDERDLLRKRIRGIADTYHAFRGHTLATRILVYGPTGTGKSSLSTVFARHLSRKMYTLSLTTFSRLSNLVSLLEGLGPDSVLVIDEMTRQDFGVWSADDYKVTGDTQLGRFRGGPGPEVTHEQFIDQLKSNLDEGDQRLVQVRDIFQCLDMLKPRIEQPLVVCVCRTHTLREAQIDPRPFDVLLKMDLATRPIITQLFRFMYDPTKFPELLPLTRSNIRTLAESFADNVPEGVMMPVSLEKFIIYEYPHDPQGAVDNVGGWCRTELARAWYQTLLQNHRRHVAPVQGPRDDEEEEVDSDGSSET